MSLTHAGVSTYPSTEPLSDWILYMIYLLIMGLTFHSYEPTLNGEGRELVVRKDPSTARGVSWW